MIEFKLLGTGIDAKGPATAGVQTAYKRSLIAFRDPLTPPQTKTECIHTVEPIPGVILCDGWHTFWRYMDVEYFLIVRTPKPEDIQKIVEGCLREAAVAALLSALVAAILSGGTAAIEAAKASFVSALLDCLVNHIQGSTIDITCEAHWTDWQ